MARIKVLHLCGSPQDAFFNDLSLFYGSETVMPEGIEAFWFVFSPEGQHQAGRSLDALAPAASLQQAVDQYGSFDLAVSHMFCTPGLGEIRAEIENDLGVRLFGSPPAVIDCAQSKAATRAVMERAGVGIAKGASIAPGQDALAAADNIALPLIVKPDSTDNSVGVSLVHGKDDLKTAIAEARRHCDTIVMEAFIPGREIRAAVIERDDGLYCPAMIEYTVSDETPIRRFDDKLDTDADGRPIGKSTGSAIRTVCPASVG
ncbi:MAG: hypothetical protein AAFO57_09270, partial [Pseudomonadota bacterium]